MVLLDNGRTKLLADSEKRESLYCIRCGACLNHCPVYRKIGGHSFPWVYSGPIGAIITPQFMGVKYEASLPFASSLCGACAEVCPVKIDIPKILLNSRGGKDNGAARRRQSCGAPGIQALGLGNVSSADLRDGCDGGGGDGAPETGGVAAACARVDECAAGARLAEPAGPAAGALQELPRIVEKALMSREHILTRCARRWGARGKPSRSRRRSACACRK